MIDCDTAYAYSADALLMANLVWPGKGQIAMAANTGLKFVKVTKKNI